MKGIFLEWDELADKLYKTERGSEEEKRIIEKMDLLEEEISIYHYESGANMDCPDYYNWAEHMVSQYKGTNYET